MSVALVASGELSHSLKDSISKHPRIVAADGGLIHCKELGIHPHLIIGDFDSCPPNILKLYDSVPKISLPRDKDKTDLEVAIEEELKRGAQDLTLYGAWGKRIDHSLTNALLLMRYPGRLKLVTEHETIFAIEKTTTLHVAVGQTLSLIPISGPATGITTNGLQWELKDG